MEPFRYPNEYYVLPENRTQRKTRRWFCNMPPSPVTPIQDGTINSSNSDVDSGDKETTPKTPEFEGSDDDADYVPNSNSETSSEESGGECTYDLEELHDRNRYRISSSTITSKTTSVTNQTTSNCIRTPEISPVQTISAVLPVEENGNNLLYGKRNRQKDFCFFCETLVQCFARHVIRNHANETEVQKLLSYPPRSKTRNQLITTLRKKGNYLNSNVVQKPVKKGTLGLSLLPCPHCFGLYCKKQLWRHVKQCNPNGGSRNAQANSQTFMLHHLKVDLNLKNKVFPKMRPDEISLIAKKDELICAFGSRYLKIHREEHFVNVTSRKMRELARLVIVIKKINPQLTTLIQILKPQNFDILLEATKTVARFDKDHETFNSPTYAMNIATSLKQCCDIAIMENLKRKYVDVSVSTAEIESDLKTLIHLINANWKFEISSHAGNDLNVNKWNKISIIPLAQDLKTLKEYLINIGNRAALNINQSSGTRRDFQNLIESVYCRIILLNRRRPGELQRLLLHTYETFTTSGKQNYEEFEEAVTPTERILMKTFKRIVIRGKRGRGVPILFSTDVQEHIRDIIRCRSQFCKTENPYLFPNVNSSKEISGYKVLQKHAKLCGAKHPEGITCTKLRKHLATLSQVFNMSETDLEQLATFMGHTIGIHRQSYRLPDDVYQTSKIAKILLLMEKGDVGQFKGKTLDEIEVQMDECLIEENQPTPNNDQELPKEVPEPLDDVNEVVMVREENETSTTKKGKRQRTLVPWTDEQKRVVCSFFAAHIRNRKPPKRSECEEIKNAHKDLLYNKDWLKIKVYIQNKYSGKCK